MPINISIMDIYPTKVLVEREQQVVIMTYYDLDSNRDRVGDTKEARFWVTIPDPGVDHEGNPVPIPDNWFQLPVTYQAGLFQMISDGLDAIKNRRGI